MGANEYTSSIGLGMNDRATKHPKIILRIYTLHSNHQVVINHFHIPLFS